MKKRFAVLTTLIATLILCVCGLMACGGVKFKVNFIVDGETYATINTNGNEILSMPEDPVKDGYEFDGWYWDKGSLTQPFTANSLSEKELKNDIKVYAKWSIKQYTLTIVYDNGEPNKVITQDYGTAIESVEKPIKEGYAFEGWSESIPRVMPNKNLTIYAVWFDCSGVFKVSGNTITGLTNYGKILSRIVIPEVINGTTITSIGFSAFCECTDLTSAIIPNSVTSIGRDAFAYCDSLTSVTIGNSVTSIGPYAFYDCTSLTRVNYLGTIDGWAQIEFVDNSANPIYYAGKLYINDQLVKEANLTTATLVSEYAFYNCSSLTSVTIGNRVTSIDEGAFGGCTSLKSVTIGNEVQTIGDSAFANCKALTSITIGSSVTSIGSVAFSGCYRLVEVINKSPSITVVKGSEDNGYLGDYALAVFNSTDAYVNKFTNENGYIVYTNGNEKVLCRYEGTETDLTLPSDITAIHIRAFYDCTSLTSIEIPNSVTSIGNSAFA